MVGARRHRCNGGTRVPARNARLGKRPVHRARGRTGEAARLHVCRLDTPLDLAAEGNGTRLILVHSGFDLDNPQHRFAFDNMGPGWRDEVLPRLAATTERHSVTR